MKGLFWTSICAVLYAYAGYPLLLWIFAKLKSRDVRTKSISPTVSIIITARNESNKIRQKIQHTLALTYPPSLLEIIVASDASDDGTDEIVQEFASAGVRLVRSPERRGKEYAQGLAVSAAQGDIVVLTDAATILEPEALSRLVRNFADPTIGAVSTEDLLVDSAGNPTAEGLYVKYEMWVRRLESQFHSLVGLSGSCFAVRKELCSEWSSILASDFMTALTAARHSYRSIADPSTRGKLVPVLSAQHEMRRKIRTFLRGITALMANLDLLNPFRYGRFAFQLASHKLLRYCVPFFLLIALTTSALLRENPVFYRLLWLQAGFYLLGCFGGFHSPLQSFALVRVAHYFTMVQWAMLIAWVKYALGYQQVTWEPSKRHGVARATPSSS